MILRHVPSREPHFVARNNPDDILTILTAFPPCLQEIACLRGRAYLMCHTVTPSRLSLISIRTAAGQVGPADNRYTDDVCFFNPPRSHRPGASVDWIVDIIDFTLLPRID